MDDAETHPAQAELVNVQGTRNVVAAGAPVVYYSTDYVFDGAKGEPYVESDEPNPLSVYGRTKLAGEREVREGWIVRSSWLFGWTGTNFVRTMLELGAKQDEVAVVDDQRGSPTFVGHLAEATKSGAGASLRHVPRRRRGECTWAGVRRGDLRGGRPRLSGPPDHDRGTGSSGPASGELRPAQRARRAGAPALARRPSSLPSPSLKAIPVSDARTCLAGRSLLCLRHGLRAGRSFGRGRDMSGV